MSSALHVVSLKELRNFFLCATGSEIGNVGQMHGTGVKYTKP
ncbi:hypothetical protein FOMG_09463 [Fusarium oxysporum f. sp. melonis 26406]|uniref:Uncharacterized protein n=1 Tax=Fusarium oxysporum f. sp. melonis 26406 TaxID=1089452 RepID=W9ZWP0_FUSOX|nr:hypothetical protein FOMG_09463 [Fusarium oxysporum f. sp. melonis 26406]